MFIRIYKKNTIFFTHNIFINLFSIEKTFSSIIQKKHFQSKLKHTKPTPQPKNISKQAPNTQKPHKNHRNSHQM